MYSNFLYQNLWREIHAVFAFISGEDPTYSRIEQGRWLQNTPYATLHQIAGNGKLHGIFSIIIEFCSEQIGHLRIDHFVDFMDQNKVPHLPVEVMGERLPFDERYNEMHAKGEIRHFIHQSPVEQQRRLEEYYLEMWKVTRNFAKQYRKSDKKVESLNKELKAIKGSKFYKLNRKYHAIKKKFKN